MNWQMMMAMTVAAAVFAVVLVAVGEAVAYFWCWLEARRERLWLRRLSELPMYLTPSQVCRRYHIQACHCCEDLSCGDNISPANGLVDASKALLAVYDANSAISPDDARRLREAVEKCEA